MKNGIMLQDTKSDEMLWDRLQMENIHSRNQSQVLNRIKKIKNRDFREKVMAFFLRQCHHIVDLSEYGYFNGGRKTIYDPDQ